MQGERRNEAAVDWTLRTDGDRVQAPYVIELRQVDIGKSPSGAYIGQVLVDKKSAVLMKEKSGSIYVYAKKCASEACPRFDIGYPDEDNGVAVGDSVRMDLRLDNYELSSARPDDWMDDFVCIKLFATQGILGREGASQWNCSVNFTR